MKKNKIIYIVLIAFIIIEPCYTYSEKNIRPELPLELYFSNQEYPDLKLWFQTKFGEAAKLDLSKPEYHARPILLSINKLKTRETSLAPPGIWHLSKCAFVYALTGDQVCGRTARSYMLKLVSSDFAPSTTQPPFLQSNVVKQIVIAFDLAYSALTPSDRQLISTNIRTKWLPPVKNYFDQNWAGSPTNLGYLQYSNQSAVYLGAMYMGGRLIYQVEHLPQYKTMYIEAAKTCRIFMQNYFLPDGSTASAPDYHMMTLEELSYVIYPMSVSLGLDVREFLPPNSRKNPFIFPLYLRSNCSSETVQSNSFPYILSFGDSSFGALYYDPVQRRQVSNRYYAIAAWSAYTGDTDLLGIYEKYANIPGIQYNESALSLVSHYRRWLMRQYGTTNPVIKNEAVFPDSGFMVWREGFGQDDKVFALLKRTKQRGDHLRFDQNVFLLEAYGDPYFTDLGVNYATDSENGYSRSDHNNSITVERRNSIDGCNGIAITPHITSARLNMVVSDASYINDINKPSYRRGCVSPITDKAVRTVLYLKPDYYIISDSIHNLKPAKIQFNSITKFKGRHKGREVIYQGQKSFMMQYLASPSQFHIIQDEVLDDKSEVKHRLSIETVFPVEQETFVNLLFPYERSRSKPSVYSASNKSAIILKVNDRGNDDTIVQKHYSFSEALIDTIRTDADTAVVRKINNKLSCAGILNGTYLEMGDQRIIKTSKKTSLVVYDDGLYLKQ